MRETIFSILGIVLCAFGVIFFIMMITLKNKGINIMGEVVSVKQYKNRFYHTLKYTVNGESFESTDNAGYNRAFEIGEAKKITCYRNKIENFKYDDEIKSNLISSICCILVGIGFVLRYIVL